MTNRKIKVTQREIYVLIMVISLFAMIFGQALNLKVMKSNNCLMPVRNLPYADSSDKHFSYSDKSTISYWYLSDYLGYNGYRFSIGDVFVYGGGLFFISHLILYGLILTQKKQNKELFASSQKNEREVNE